MTDVIVLKPVPESIKAARDAIAFVAAEWGIDDYIPRVVVSELAAGALRVSAADAPIIVRAYDRDGKHTIEVRVQTNGTSRKQKSDQTGEDCLTMLSLLVERCGVRREGGQDRILYAELLH